METISGQTKISALIKANPKSVEAIASLAKPLEKLKNPILRKIMASRVTIAEAAKMGGCTIDDFKRVLIPLGFSFVEEKETSAESVQNPRPLWLQDIAREAIDFYDVRPIIDNGADPLKEILHRFKEVTPGSILCIINSFVPTPLIHLLQQEKAEASFVETISPTEHHTYFLKKQEETAAAIPPTAEKLMMDSHEAFNEICKRFTPERTKEVDVRELEMPLPMQTILAALEALPSNHALYVHHKRVPVYLLEELADKDYEIHIDNMAEGNVKMLIFKKE